MLNHPTLLEHVDLVGIDDLTNVMRDDNHRATLFDGIDRGLDLLGGDGIEAGGGLVEEDNGRILDEHTGDGDALLLAATELESSGLEAMWQGHNLIVDIGLTGGTHHIVVGGLRTAIADVFLDGAVEDMILLEYEAYILAQPLGIPLMEAHTIERDATLLGLVELIEQIDDGALACTTETYEGGNLATRDAHRDIEEGLSAIGVSEIDMGELEVALHLGGMVLACGLYLAIGMENAKEPLGIDQGIVHIVVDAMELADGGADVGKEHDMVHNLTYRHARIIDEYEVGCEDDNEHSTNLFQKTLQAIKEVGFLAGGELQIGHGALDGGLTIGLYLFAIERLDNGDALEDIQDALGYSLMAAKDTSTPTLHLGGLDIGDPEIKGYDAEGHEAYIDIGDEHKGQGQYGTGKEWQNLDEEIINRIRKAHNATIDARLELARFVALAGEERHTEREDALDDAQGEIATDEDTHALAIVALEEGDNGAHHLLT